eukprot:g28464.t1
MGNMKIIEVAANGHFVRLLNISLNMEEDIGNYILQQNIGGHPVTVYRFPPRTRVNAGSTITSGLASIQGTKQASYIRQRFTCTSVNVVYCIRCSR